MYIKSKGITLGLTGAPDEHQELIRCTVVTGSHIVVGEGQSAQGTVTVGDSSYAVSQLGQSADLINSCISTAIDVNQRTGVVRVDGIAKCDSGCSSNFNTHLC